MCHFQQTHPMKIIPDCGFESFHQNIYPANYRHLTYQRWLISSVASLNIYSCYVNFKALSLFISGLVFTVYEHRNICIAEANSEVGYATVGGGSSSSKFDGNHEFLAIVKVPISLVGSLRIWKEHKKVVSKFFTLFWFGSIFSLILTLKHDNFQKNQPCLGAWDSGTRA